MTTQELREVVRNWVVARIEHDPLTELENAMVEKLVTMLDHHNADPDLIRDVLDEYAECAVDLAESFSNPREVGRFVRWLSCLAPSENGSGFRFTPEGVFNRIIGKQP